MWGLKAVVEVPEQWWPSHPLCEDPHKSVPDWHEHGTFPLVVCVCQELTSLRLFDVGGGGGEQEDQSRGSVWSVLFFYPFSFFFLFFLFLSRSPPVPCPLYPFTPLPTYLPTYLPHTLLFLTPTASYYRSTYLSYRSFGITLHYYIRPGHAHPLDSITALAKSQSYFPPPKSTPTHTYLLRSNVLFFPRYLYSKHLDRLHSWAASHFYILFFAVLDYVQWTVTPVQCEFVYISPGRLASRAYTMYSVKDSEKVRSKLVWEASEFSICALFQSLGAYLPCTLPLPRLLGYSFWCVNKRYHLLHLNLRAKR